MMTKKKAPAKSSTSQNAAVRLGQIEQQINNLIKAITAQQQSIMSLADEIDKARELTLGVARRLNASISAAEAGPVSHESVNNVILNQNVKSLENLVETMVKEKVLESKDSEIESGDFVVGRETDKDGKVTNPRLQFLLSELAQDENAKEFAGKLVGKKVMETVEFSDKLDFTITEIYKVNDEKELELDTEQKEA